MSIIDLIIKSFTNNYPEVLRDFNRKFNYIIPKNYMRWNHFKATLFYILHNAFEKNKENNLNSHTDLFRIFYVYKECYTNNYPLLINK